LQLRLLERSVSFRETESIGLLLVQCLLQPPQLEVGEILLSKLLGALPL